MNAVSEKFDDGFAGIVAVVLMDQQVDRRLAEDPETGRVIASARRYGINLT
ncbi:MAG: hypothetical protein HQL07_04820 [Nitrospirae bacterium]|nr:hypothetical protein [Magnetococcales bacterium]